MIKNKTVISNTAMLYIMSIVKLILPLVTLPYLTRVLTEESYGLVSYVKSCMTYMQLFIDFGFILSSVKDIAFVQQDKHKIGEITGNTFVSKLILALFAFIVLIGMMCSIRLLRLNIFYVLLSFLAVALSALFADFLFRGIEKMSFITLIYVVSKGASVFLTFVWVKSDADLMLVPVLDIVTNLLAVLFSFMIIRKLEITVRFTGFRDCWKMIQDSFTYFLSSIATTAFSALNTLLIGIFILDLGQVAYWSLCMSMISAIQGLYAPICNGIYPHMIKEKNLGFIHRILLIFMPIVTVGCVFSFFFARTALLIVGGEKYVEATTLFRCMIPILFFSFPAQVYGWPTLGAVGKVKSVTASTVITAGIQVLGLVILAITNGFTLINMAILRCGTEALLMCIRIALTYKSRSEFCHAE